MKPAESAAPTCRIETDPTAWLALREPWNRLFDLTGTATPWQSWDFQSRWWQRLAGIRRLRICVVECNDRAVLILPLQITSAERFGMRVLEPIGMPDDINRPRLALGSDSPAAYAAAFAAIWRIRHEWDAIRIDERRLDEPEMVRLNEFARAHGLAVRAIPLHPCPYLDLRQSWPTFLAARSARLRKNLGAARRKLAARGPVRVEQTDDPAAVVAAFDVLLDIQSRSWKQGERIGLSKSEQYRTQQRDFVAAMAAQHRARASILYCDSRPIAGTVAFFGGDTYYSAHIAHDEAYAQCSPGTLLEAHELQALMQEGRFANYDFLGGALNNKRRWTDAAIPTDRIWIFQATWRATVFKSVYFLLKPLVKRLLHRRLPQSATDVALPT
jgi:CelD/BcsL family acetyltransferase involved in cellulose biosynthesis